jgi:hypothetical protein
MLCLEITQEDLILLLKVKHTKYLLEKFNQSNIDSYKEFLNQNSKKNKWLIDLSKNQPKLKLIPLKLLKWISLFIKMHTFIISIWCQVIQITHFWIMVIYIESRNTIKYSEIGILLIIYKISWYTLNN